MSKETKKIEIKEGFDNYNRETLIAFFEELIDVMGLSDDETKELLEVPLDITDEELYSQISEAISIINPVEDVFSNDAQEIINELLQLNGVKSIEEEEEENAEQILEEIQSAKTLKELKTIASKYRILKDINKKSHTYRFKEDLRDDMLRAFVPTPEELGDVEEEPDVEKNVQVDDAQSVADKLHEKNIASKPVEVISEEEPKEPAKIKKSTKKPPAKKPASKKSPAKEPSPEKPAPKKEQKVDKVTSQKVIKYTRTRAVAEIVKNNPDASVEDIIKWADDLFVENGGQSNLRHSRVQYNIIKQVLEIFEVV